MNRAEIDESEHVAAQTSDLRSTNPWLASYGRDPARGSRVRESRRATRSSGAAALKLRLWTGAAAAALLMLGISELVRMADFLRAHPATVAQIVGHADDRGDAAANRRVEILVQKSPTESLP